MLADDHTNYPFATNNAQDYRNLQSIYMDAVFAPKLDKSDFMQEGWRLDGNNFKGIVYNEMKGALSDPDSLYSSLLSYFFYGKNCTYGQISGGLPEHILREATFDRLVSFYKKFYHPERAKLFSYGNCIVFKLFI